MSTQPGNYQTFKENQKSERMALNSNNMNKVNRTNKTEFQSKYNMREMQEYIISIKINQKSFDKI